MSSGRRKWWRSWGPPLTLYVLVLLVASIGISVSREDGHLWWVPLLGGFVVVPAGVVLTILVIFGLQAAWDKALPDEGNQP